MSQKHILGITVSKSENFPEWYVQTVLKGELLEYTDISGCYVMRPNSYGIWENIQQYFNQKIMDSGVRNSYFPVFVSRHALEAESDFVEGFTPEVAWVTKSGSSELAEPIAVRPTSEAIMYPMFSKWIRSWRDMPLRLNQWCNVVRWEFKQTIPFIRSREFLWQEGHSAFATQEEADDEVLEILEYYRQVYEDLLAIPVIKGTKTDIEKFAGGNYTTTIEAFIPANGRAVQAATSHSLGQNFSKAFDISFEIDRKTRGHAWQNSWGLTTRSIGVMIMVHGDDNGLIIPPRVAPKQIVLVPITKKNNQDEIIAKAEAICASLRAAGLRAVADVSTNHKPGFKYNYYELTGVPIRLEFGQMDMENNQVVAVRRDTKEKIKLPQEGLAEALHDLLEEIHNGLYEKALAERDAHMPKAYTLEEFISVLNGNMVLVPFCERGECEENVKDYTEHNTFTDEAESQFALTGKAKSLCIPMEQDELPEGTKCFACEMEAKRWCLFGRSY